MTKAELIACVRKHEAGCMLILGAAFSIVAMMEIADGVIAVKESDGEHTIYFDQSKWRVIRNSPLPDLAQEIKSMPKGVGFIENVMARNWGAISETARMCLKCAKGKTKWHKEPVPIS